MSDCAIYVGVTRSLVCKMCRDKIVHNKYFFSNEYLGLFTNLSDRKTSKTQIKRIVKLTRNWEMY